MTDPSSVETLHASAVVTPAGVAALCARSGTGKSTLAAHLDTRGFRAWADDAVVWMPQDESAVTFRAAAGTDRARALAAVFVLDRADAAGAQLEVEVRRVSGAAALTGVLTHAHPCPSDDLARRRSFVDSYAHLAATVPVISVRFRPDLRRLSVLGDACERVLASLDRWPRHPRV